MTSLTLRFLQSEDGAVTVDWVILTAGVVGLALAATMTVIDGTEDISGDIETQLSSPMIQTSF